MARAVRPEESPERQAAGEDALGLLFGHCNLEQPMDILVMYGVEVGHRIAKVERPNTVSQHRSEQLPERPIHPLFACHRY